MIEIERENWGVRADPQSVEAWSTRRLPFEPRGWQVEFRDELRGALRQLRAVDGYGLSAEYETPDRKFSDVENVLLYNVGSGAYGHLVGSGLELRRVPSRDERHWFSYRVGPPPRDLGPTAGAPLATVRVPIGVGAATPNSAGTWWRLLRPAISVPAHKIVHAGDFTVAVELDGIEGSRSVAGLVKPLLDGLISALHVQRPAPAHPDDAISSRLALLGDPDHLWRLLTDDSVAVLGDRSLVRAGKSNLVWNPGDDRGSAISLTVRAGDSPAVTAAVFAAT